MKKIDLVAILKSKIQNDNASHFYILSPSSAISEASMLRDWVLGLLAQTLSDNKKKFDKASIINHEDLILIQKLENEAGKYKLSDFTEMFSFLNYNATRAPRKFIIIDSSEKLSTAVANKLLKTLEEPPIKCTIFLLNAQKVSPLETVKSRAISLTVPFDKSISSDDFIQGIIDKVKMGMTLDEFVLIFKGKKSKEKDLFPQLNNWFMSQSTTSQQIWKLDLINKQSVIDNIYNAAPLNRLHKIYFLLKDLIDG